MAVAQLTVDFHLPGCRSLKDKRRRVAKLRDKFGKQTGVAVFESAHADDLSRSQWTFVAAASSATVVTQALADVERYVTTAVDGEVLDLKRDWMN